jgi:D-alanyl-D-alanine carboxypeptidase
MTLVRAKLLPTVATLAMIGAFSPLRTNDNGRAPANFATFVSNYAASHHFNGTITVEEDGRTIFGGGFGVADRSFDVRCRMDTKYKIASITKAFTSVLILQLGEEGKVDLNAFIKTYLPTYSGDGAGKVTIHDLLNHTSGLPNLDAGYSSVDDALKRGMPQYQTYATPDELISRFYSGKLVHEPGTVFDYNNADYIILGRIIEVVAGKPFEEVLRERILSRLGMKNTGLLHQQDMLVNLAPTYFTKDSSSSLVNDLPAYIEDWYAAGGMYSTVGDLMAFADALYGGKLLSQQSLDAMLKPGLDGYGYGLWIGSPTFGGKSYRSVNRPGRIMGANGSFYHFNGVGFGKTINIVILSNTNLTDMDAFSLDIGKELLK